MGRGCGDEECRGDVPPRGTAVWPPFAHGRLWDGELLSVHLSSACLWETALLAASGKAKKEKSTRFCCDF